MAQAGAPGGLRPAKRMAAVPIGGPAPRIDGRLDDPTWQRARWFSDFLQKEPIQGAEPTEKTEVAFIYDGAALYVGARMYTSNPADVRALVTRRDQHGNSDLLVVSLDTYRDLRTAYSFGVSAAGVRLDWYHPQDNEHVSDLSFDPVWEARTTIDSLGWTAEMRIPFSQLRFTEQEVQVWGVNVSRFIPAKNEEVFWIYVPRNETGWSSWFGELVGIAGIAPSSRIELMPYLASAATLTSRSLVDPGDPFTDRIATNARVGADVKMGLGPNLTLDATVNPDFGQVEADPAEVNLTQFETFFDERRPFFIEGGRLLQGQGPAYFYSRRIGAPPRVSAQGDFVDSPKTSMILGAVKVTGRLESGLSVGALAAATAREYARTFGVTDGAFGRSEVGPLSGFGVLRLQQEFGPAASTVGLSLTGVRRDVPGGEPLASLLARQAYAGGVDWNLRFSRGTYEIGGFAGFSYVQGDSGAMAQVQRSSAHYFQRPDQDHVTFDPSRTSLPGYTAGMSVQKRAGKHWLWQVSGTARSPAFEINDAGQLRTADDAVAFGSLSYRETEPGPIFRRYAIELSAGSGWNFGGVRQFSRAALALGGQFRNFMSASLMVGGHPRALNDDATRGGPLLLVGASWDVSAGVFTNPNTTTTWRATGLYLSNETGSWRYTIGAGLALRPVGRWSFSVDPGYQRLVEARQYVVALPTGPAETFGTRYLFASVERSQLSARFRLAYSLTPDLSLELYAEPFAASGRFFDIGELKAARTTDLKLYGAEGTTLTRDTTGAYTITDGPYSFGLPNLDFNVRSFRSNVVVRWEWHRGSTLFFVWQRNRFSRDPRGGLVTPAGLFDAFNAEGENFFAVKLSYWVPVT